MSEFAHQVGFRKTLRWDRDGGITACWLPKEAPLVGIEAEFEHMAAPGGAEIVVISTNIEPPVRSHVPKPATARQVLKDAIKVEHLRFPFWAIGATRVRRRRIGL